MRIDQALHFIHACPPGKFESLSDLLSPELVPSCFFEKSVSCADGACPMEPLGHYRDVLFRHVAIDVAQTSSISFTRRPAVCRPQRLHPGAPKLACRCSTGVPADRHTLASSVQHPPGPALQLLAVDGVPGARPIPGRPAPFPSRNRPGDAISPAVRMVSDGADRHLLTDRDQVNEMVFAEQPIATR